VTEATSILIATPLETEHVRTIAAAAPDAEVLFDPELLPPPRYPSDHRGPPDWRRGSAAQARWLELLRRATILYGIPGDSGPGLAAALDGGPLVRWVQGTAAGSGETVRAANLKAAVLGRVAFTSAAGVHGTMLAEFVFGGILALRKDFRRLDRIRAERAWPHFASGELRGSTLVVVGMGSIGRAVANLGRAFGMRVVAVTRSGSPPAADAVTDPGAVADAVYPIERIGDAFALADTVVVTLPATAKTRRVVDAAALRRLPPNAIVCNVGRGATIDQTALTRALERGAIAGAVLDVFDPEPLPPKHSLWTLENVVFSPHTMALSVRENARIVELFCDNLGRFARGTPLRNRIDTREFY